MTPEKYKISSQATRLLSVLRLLFGHTVDGMQPGQIAKAIDDSQSNVTRILAYLQQTGFAEEMQGDKAGRWRLGPAMVQGALAHEEDLRQAEHQINEVRQRYSRRPD